MKRYKKFFLKCLGGRPMQFICFSFQDTVSGKPVNYYKDCFNRYWMANDKWGWFRVKTDKCSAEYNKVFNEKGLF